MLCKEIKDKRMRAYQKRYNFTTILQIKLCLLL